MSALPYLIDPSWGIAGLIDVETTGLNPGKDEIIEFSIVLFAFDQDTGEIKGIVDEYTGLCDPGRSIPKTASEIHGITKRDVKGKKLNTYKIDTMIRQADFLISHNAKFDSKFVRILFPIAYAKPWLCSMNDIDWKSKGFRSKALQNLLKDHNITVDEAHRANSDVKACLALLYQKNSEGNYYFYELLQCRKVAAASNNMPITLREANKAPRSFNWLKALLITASIIILPIYPFLGIAGIIASFFIRKPKT